MRLMKRAFISLAILVAICLGGYFVYNMAYANGEAVGYETGHSVGHEAGYSLGKEEGYVLGKEDGYVLGKEDGYDEGYVSGEREGYGKGYVSGEADGYRLGKTDGYEDGYDEGIEAGLGHGYTLRDPAYEEAVAFLREDKTDKNEYIEATYVCSHFARDVCNNAEVEGLRCAFIEMRYSDGGHSIIAFNTIDKGLVYFEPQSDMIAKPVIGKRWYQCKEPPPGYYYAEPVYDDTIMDILVIW